MTDPSSANIAALHEQRDWFRVTLASIGDAVITIDAEARVTFLNPVAVSLTGWALPEAVGQPLDCVFRIINEESRHPVESPTVRAFREGRTVKLAKHSLLVARDVARRICQQPWGAAVALVALTGWGQDEDRRRSHEAGFDFHVVKPVDLAALEQLLAGSRATP